MKIFYKFQNIKKKCRSTLTKLLIVRVMSCITLYSERALRMRVKQ